MTDEAILEVRGLHTQFNTREGVVKALNGVSVSLKRESILALVGESGSGKTVLALSIMGLVPYPGSVVKGEVLFEGRDLLKLPEEEMRRVRGKEISIVFQDARSALNPLLPIGVQMQEIFLAHEHMSKKQALAYAADLLKEVGMPDPKKVLERYPFQLSGGMCQRVMISIALALRPKVLIADEPTSNLDTTLQAEILDRIRTLAKQLGSAVMLVTHDMGVVAQMASEVAVMYAGSVVESGEVVKIFQHTSHPYTWGLFQAIPRVDQVDRRLTPIRGGPPNLIDLPDKCPFIPRCPKANNTCRLEKMPPLEEIEPGHKVACYNRVLFEYLQPDRAK